MNWSFRKVLTRQLIEDGKKLPRGYGFAWRDFDTASHVAYPIPLNVLFRGLRRFWHWIVGGYKNSVIDEARIKGIHEGQELARSMRNVMVPPTKSTVLRLLKETKSKEVRGEIKKMYHYLLYGTEK